MKIGFPQINKAGKYIYSKSAQVGNDFKNTCSNLKTNIQDKNLYKKISPHKDALLGFALMAGALMLAGKCIKGIKDKITEINKK